MKLPELIKALEVGENQHLQFAGEKPDLSAVGRTICGFLNSGGGTVVCGIDEMRGMPGVAKPQETRRRLEEMLERDLSPKALVSAAVHGYGDEPYLIVHAPAGKDIPYAFRNVVYLRHGVRVVKATIDEVREMVLRKSAEPERWERRLSVLASDSDSDSDELQLSVSESMRMRTFPFRDRGDSTKILEDLSMARFGRLTQGGAVLFGKNVARHYPQVRVRAACYERDQSDAAYLDSSTYEGPLVPALNHLLQFIMRNSPVASRFHPGDARRHDEPLYPLDAVREGLVNAFAHRDYADSSGGLGVHLYPDRLVIWNSGFLPEGVTPELLREHGAQSVLRNPDIANVLYVRGYMERLGRGSLLISRACEEAGLPSPVWSSEAGIGVTLTMAAAAGNAKHSRPASTPAKGSVSREHAPQVTPPVTPQGAPQVTPQDNLVLVLDGERTRQELMSRLGLKNNKHFREHYLHPALESGLIEMTIPERPNSRMQRYRLTPRGLKLRKRSDTS